MKQEDNDNTNRIIQITNIMPTKKRANPNQGRVYSKKGLAPSINTCNGGNRQPMIEVDEYISIKNANKKGYEEAYDGDSVNLSYPASTSRRGRVGHEVAQTVQATDVQGVVVNGEELRIRRLTPREYWRLMGFTDEEFNKASSVNSNAQLYKQAGNSIVVNIMMAIIKNLLSAKMEIPNNHQLTLF